MYNVCGPGGWYLRSKWVVSMIRVVVSEATVGDFFLGGLMMMFCGVLMG